MKNKSLFIGCLALCCAASIGAVALVANSNNSFEPASAKLAHTKCASLNFGLDESTVNYLAEEVTGTGSVNINPTAISGTDVSYASTPIGTADGITINTYTVTADLYYKNDCLKFGKSKNKNGALQLNVAQDIVGVDVYAVGWKGDSGTLAISDGTTTIGTAVSVVASSDVTGTTTDPMEITFKKYSFDFNEAVNTIKLVVAGGRMIVGDIAFRVA